MTAWTSELGIPTAEESAAIKNLLSIIGGSEAQAGEVLDVLRRNGGNADKAAEVLLGISSSSSASTSTALVPFKSGSGARSTTPVDSTKDAHMDVDDDDEMRRALEMSLQGPDNFQDHLMSLQSDKDVEAEVVEIRMDDERPGLKDER